MGSRFLSASAAIFLLFTFLSARTGSAQCASCPGAPLPVGKCSTGTVVQTGTGCSFNNCQIPQISGPSFEAIDQGGGQFTVRMFMTVTAPWNKSSAAGQPNGTLDMTWFNVSPAPTPWTAGGSPSLCEELNSDVVPTYVEKNNLSCAGAPYDLGAYSLRSSVCGGPCSPPFFPNCGSIGWCGRWVDSNGLAFYVTKSMLGCPDDPPKDSCDACLSCVGPGGGTNAAGGPPSFKGAGTGRGALLRYRGRGAGSNASFPGTTAWNGILGRNWSHDYAERILVDPDQRHVWLITRDAVFREFSSLNPSTGIYQTNSPSDEYRTLKWLGAGLGWQLTDLDGTVDTFDSSGLWLRRQDKNGNAKVATYTSGVLTSVAQPDGLREDFTYHVGTGLLASITYYGVGGSPSQQWLYTWTGLDLTRIDRPDGTALEFIYDGTGLLTRIDLVGTDLSRRVETAWEYDVNGNVAKTWKGDPVFSGPNAVEKYSFSYTNPALPTATDVTDPLGNVSTYTIGRDIRSTKAKILSISGGCPSCGVGPNSTFEYNDGRHPLLPSAVIDGKGNRTDHVYNNKGRMTSKTEAVGTALARVTTLAYGNATYPGFPTRIEKPSTSGGTNKRATAFTYNGTGDLTNETITGREAGSSFTHATVRTYNSAGRPLTIDPPGYTTAPTDVVTFTYNVTGRNNLLPDTRTDPIIGATTFEYDAWNRRTAVIDPNSVRTETAYDDMNRVLTITQKGAVAGDDLVTTHEYNAVGDLLRTTLPQGNVIEYGYDTARRLVSIERKPDAVTPKERTLYTLDGASHRTKEELQHWNGTAWVTGSVTMFQYSSSCHLDKILHADGSVTEYAYDCNGNLEKIWDANHPSAGQTNPATQVNAYDALNRLTSITQPWAGAGGGSAVTSYTYDVQDHLASVTDANGNVTTYTTSDRDLVTQQVSPVSGTTNYTYTTHGILASEADARPITVTRTVDPLDRVTFLNYPDNTLDTTFTYDAVAVPFSKGRLTSITRNGVSINYTYDRFGRVTQDGALTHTYDKNGNRLTVGYPFSVTATYGYDFADRPSTLEIQDGANPVQTLVSSASYKPFGPLSDLSLGNGNSETHAFDARYFPEGITVPGRLDWAYTVDFMGNVTAIADNLNAANDRTYAYQDYHYFLTTGNGPWGARSWTYDKTGNRLTEGGDTYTYTLNGGANNTPKLSSIALGGGGSRSYTYDAIGDVTGIGGTTLAYNNVRRLRQIGTDLTFLYDGRDFLRQSSKTLGGGGGTDTATPTYNSEGLFHHRRDVRNAGALQSDYYVFHFAGRPVASLEKIINGGVPSSTLLYLTTDHLGTPILACDTAGVKVWEGGFEPFGKDYAGAQAAGVPLRFPGQWQDATWAGYSANFDLSYNLYRWYDGAVGRYTRPDPLGLRGGIHLYVYGGSNPMGNTDPLGLDYNRWPTRGRVHNNTHCNLLLWGETGPEGAGQRLGVSGRSEGFSGSLTTSTPGVWDVDFICWNRKWIKVAGYTEVNYSGVFTAAQLYSPNTYGVPARPEEAPPVPCDRTCGCPPVGDPLGVGSMLPEIPRGTGPTLPETLPYIAPLGPLH